MKPSRFSNGISRLSGSSLRTIFPSRRTTFPMIAVQLKRRSPQLQLDRSLLQPKRKTQHEQRTCEDRCPRKCTKAELAEIRRIAGKNDSSCDEHRDGQNRSHKSTKAAPATPELRYTRAILL